MGGYPLNRTERDFDPGDIEAIYGGHVGGGMVLSSTAHTGIGRVRPTSSVRQETPRPVAQRQHGPRGKHC